MEPRTTKRSTARLSTPGGIRHEVTERYYSESNGLAERLNLTIMDKVRCMLIDANLIPKLWPYAAHYAVLIYNNLPHSAHYAVLILPSLVNLFNYTEILKLSKQETTRISNIGTDEADAFIFWMKTTYKSCSSILPRAKRTFFSIETD